jgi:hypothetical protein
VLPIECQSPAWTGFFKITKNRHLSYSINWNIALAPVFIASADAARASLTQFAEDGVLGLVFIACSDAARGVTCSFSFLELFSLHAPVRTRRSHSIRREYS